MKHIALTLLTILTVGCMSTPEHKVAWDLGSVWVYKTDQELYGVEEYVTLPKEEDGLLYGDCEDYALEAQRRLAELGIKSTVMTGVIPASSRMSGITKEQGHAFLVTENGYVLDNNLRNAGKLEHYPIKEYQPLADW